MIELAKVDVVVSPEFAVRDIDLQLENQKYAVLMGPTGCGKSTVLESICGLRRVTSGVIRINGRAVTNLRPAERDIGYVPQDLALFQQMTVADHFRFGPRLRGWKRDRIEARVDELLDDLKMTPLRERKPAGLSGGESQRVALGRALASEPSALLLDEPLSALDESTSEEMLQLLERLRDQRTVTVLHVTHRSLHAERLGDVVFRMESGRLVTDKG